MDITGQEFDNYECFEEEFRFVGHSLEPYTRNGIKQIHKKICVSLAANVPCQQKCSLIFGDNVRWWCKTCDNWRKQLLSFCSVPATMPWSKMESWKWPLEYTSIALVYLPRSWNSQFVDFNDISTACSLWKRCSAYHINARIVKLVEQYIFMCPREHKKVSNEEKQRVFYTLGELFYQPDVERSLMLDSEKYINELFKIRSKQKDRIEESKHQHNTEQLRKRFLFLVVFNVFLIFVRILTLYIVDSIGTDLLVEDVRFHIAIAMTPAVFYVAERYLYLFVDIRYAYGTGLAEKLLKDYECRGLYKPWNPHIMLKGMFALALQHGVQSEIRDIFKRTCTIVSGANTKQSRLCIADVLNIWGDTIKYRKKHHGVQAETTSAIAHFNLVFYFRARRDEDIYDLNEFIFKRVSSYLNSLNVKESVWAILNRKCLVIIDLSEGRILSPSKLYLQIMGKYKIHVLLFVHHLQVMSKHLHGIYKLSCSELLAQCGGVTTLYITQRKGVRWSYMLNTLQAFVMKNLRDEISSALVLKTFQCRSSTKIFDIVFQDICSPNSSITIKIDLRNEHTKSGRSHVRNLELINCDSSIMFLHPAEKVSFKKQHYLNDLFISNCMRCFPSCVNLRTVVFSDIIIGREQIGITLYEDEIEKFKSLTGTHDVVLEIFMPCFEHSTSFNKEDFDIENRRCNSYGKEIILNQICFELVKSDPNIEEAYASTSKDDNVILVGLTRDSYMTYQSCQIFKNFNVEVRPYFPSSKVSLRAENSVESADEILHENSSKQYFAINETVSYHAEKLMEQHSNLEAIKVSLVHVSDENCVKACHCIVLYCRCKAFIPYGESSFPTYLKHPSEDITFLTNVREGYFIPCTNGNVMTGFAKLWNQELAMGCSIGPENEPFSATCGPFVDVKETGDTCFLTVRHLFQPLSKPDQQVIGTNLVQPADGDIIPSQPSANNNPAGAGIAGQQQGNSTPERRCGKVYASALSETVDAALVKIDDVRVPKRGNYVNVTKNDLCFAGFSDEKFPTFDDGSTIDARLLTVHNQATDRVIKFGKETGLRKGTLRLSSMVVKEGMCTGSVQMNGRSYGHMLKSQLQIDSYASSTFFQAGDSGSAVFLVDKNNKLHCIGMAIGVMSDLTAVVTPIQNSLGRQLGKTLEIKKFEFEKMEES